MGFVAVPYMFVCGFCFCECFRCLGGCVGFYGSWQFEGVGVDWSMAIGLVDRIIRVLSLLFGCSRFGSSNLID